MAAIKLSLIGREESGNLGSTYHQQIENLPCSKTRGILNITIKPHLYNWKLLNMGRNSSFISIAIEAAWCWELGSLEALRNWRRPSDISQEPPRITGTQPCRSPPLPSPLRCSFALYRTGPGQGWERGSSGAQGGVPVTDTVPVQHLRDVTFQN